MAAYEYKAIDLSLLGGTDSVIEAFNEQGAIGWELVSVMGGVGYFKRSSDDGFSSANVAANIQASDSMTIVTTKHPSGEEVEIDESEPPKRKVGRPPRAEKNIGMLRAEDTLMPSPESLA